MWMQVIFPDVDVAAIVREESYRALLRIREILDEPLLSDEECFGRIEEIVMVFEGLGSDGAAGMTLGEHCYPNNPVTKS